ncbi:Glyoxalase/Bleomycin resistance protein/Dihydroxybiphenyl dioxygenase [Aspergillus falconensis]
MTLDLKPIRLARLAHVYYTHNDLSAASQFRTDFGFQKLTQTVSPTTGQRTIYYCGTTTQQPFVYCAREGPEDAFSGAAFVVESREDLDYAAKALPGATGVVDLEAEGVHEGGLCLYFPRSRWRYDFVCVLDFSFPPLLLLTAPCWLRWTGRLKPMEKHRPGNCTQRFKPGPAPVHKLGHFGMCVTDFARAYEFYTTRFNFKPSDPIHGEAGNVTAFLHLDRGRELVGHHCFFLFGGPKSHVDHSSFETHDFDTQLLGHHWLREFDPPQFILEHYVDGDMVDETYPVHCSRASPDNLHVWGESLVLFSY